MKTLILLRHAKSEPQSFNKKDFDRSIIDRGINDITKIAIAFKELNLHPDMVLCSTSKRTRMTLDYFSRIIVDIDKVNFVDELYHASASEILQVIDEHVNDEDCIMVVGHNFGISNLANVLSSTGAEEMPTSGIHIFQFDKIVKPYEGKLIHSLRPKSI